MNILTLSCTSCAPGVNVFEMEGGLSDMPTQKWRNIGELVAENFS